MRLRGAATIAIVVLVLAPGCLETPESGAATSSPSVPATKSPAVHTTDPRIAELRSSHDAMDRFELAILSALEQGST